MNFNRDMLVGMFKKRVCTIGARIAKEPKSAIGIGKGGVETKRQDPNGNGGIKKDFRLGEENEVRIMDCN